MAQEGRVAAALQAAESLAKAAVALAAREHAQAGGEELTQLMRAVAMRLDAAASPAGATLQAEMDVTSRALEGLVGSSQRTEALLTKGIAALQQVAEGLGDVRGLLLERLPERAPPSRTLPAVAVGQRVRVRNDVEEPAFGWGAAKSGMIGTVCSVSEADGTCLIDFPGLSKLWRSKLDEVEVVVPDQIVNYSDGCVEKEDTAKEVQREGEEEEGKEEDVASRIAVLVQQLGPGSSAGVQQAAASSLRHMANFQSQSKTLIAAAGAIPVLVKLLDEVTDTSVQEQAAITLSSLAHENAEHQAAIAAAGAIPALVQLLQGSKNAQEAAADALYRLARDHAQNQTAIAAAGAIPALVKLLHDSKNAQLEAACALGSLARHHAQNQTAIAAAGAIPAVVKLLEPGTYDIVGDFPMHIAETLDALAAGHAENQTAMVAAGAIPAMVVLLHDSECAQEDAANVLYSLARHHAQNQTAITAAGAIPHLVQLLGSNCRVVVWEHVAEALHALATGHAQNQTAISAAIAAAGTIPALVKLLQDQNTDDEAQGAAARALGSLARHHAQYQTAIADAGAIPALVELLWSECGEDVWAAKTLNDLAAGHAENQTAIAAAGAIPILVEMHDHDAEDAQEAAAAALYSLADGHAQNQAAIAAAKKQYEEGDE
ncbi:hypothetical protein FOA52_014504 [Chlamydomonas sp. UWO 241]|nr:hypothetical protein FOA52_014504 [Chlamydomonas sp. UWO 241]